MAAPPPLPRQSFGKCVSNLLALAAHFTMYSVKYHDRIQSTEYSLTQFHLIVVFFCQCVSIHLLV